MSHESQLYHVKVKEKKKKQVLINLNRCSFRVNIIFNWLSINNVKTLKKEDNFSIGIYLGKLLSFNKKKKIIIIHQ